MASADKGRRALSFAAQGHGHGRQAALDSKPSFAGEPPMSEKQANSSLQQLKLANLHGIVTNHKFEQNQCQKIVVLI
jgi:hypothetical protein